MIHYCLEVGKLCLNFSLLWGTALSLWNEEIPFYGMRECSSYEQKAHVFIIFLVCMVAYFTPTIQITSNYNKSIPKRRLPKEELSISELSFLAMRRSPPHPCPLVLCSSVKAVKADMGQLPNIHNIMSNFSKVPIKTLSVFQEVRSWNNFQLWTSVAETCRT